MREGIEGAALKLVSRENLAFFLSFLAFESIEMETNMQVYLS